MALVVGPLDRSLSLGNFAKNLKFPFIHSDSIHTIPNLKEEKKLQTNLFNKFDDDVA